LCLRARAYCCKRNFELAIKDYKTVLQIDPNDYTAAMGYAEITQIYEELPMLDTSIIDS
jgi:cytochrome c-type biogenesis protein CcmH/NrfG